MVSCLKIIALKMTGGWVYIITDKTHKYLYTGVTSALPARIEKHKKSFYPNSFTSKYKCFKLVYYEIFGSIVEAIAEEKRIKGGSRLKKIKLIESMNPEWVELQV